MATNNSTNTSKPITVAQGGTGDSSVTAYAVLCGGTTSTGVVQSVSGVGTSGQLLTSNGASALPTWQAAPAGGSWTLIHTDTASTSASLAFTSAQVTGYSEYAIVLVNVQNDTGTVVLNMDWSVNNGSGYLGSGYQSGLLSNPYNSTTLTNANSTSTNPLTPSTVININTSGILFLSLPASAVASFTGQLFTQNLTTNLAINCYGSNSGTTTINNIKFSYSSGNILSGTISLYGLST